MIFFVFTSAFQTNQIIEIIFAWNPAYRLGCKDSYVFNLWSTNFKRPTREHDLAAREQNFCTSVPIFNEDVYTSLSYITYNICLSLYFEKLWNLITFLKIVLPLCKNQSRIEFLCDHFFGSKYKICNQLVNKMCIAFYI